MNDTVGSPRPAALEMRGISKTFGATRALQRVDLSAHAGEVLALMGENGAGKSTLIKILAGAHHADPGGEIRINGQPVRIQSPVDARAAGVAVIYQELALSPNLSVAENIYLNREVNRFGWIDRGAMSDGCRAVLERLGAGFGPATRVSDLSIAERQLVEIARAVHARSRILVMDEPTTALSSRETDKLFAVVRQLRADGLAIVYISHRMAEVYELADRVTVLRDGANAGTLSRAELNPAAIVTMMVGRDISSFYRKEHRFRPTGLPVFEVRGLADDSRVRGVSFSLHAGEVLGLAGLVGAGRTELARLIFGAEPKTSGEVLLDGKPLSIASPRDAIDAGLVYLTEDRKAQGVFLDMSALDNINLMVIGRDARMRFWLNRPAGQRRALAAVGALSIRLASPAAPVGALSGGNQQKVLLSRLLEAKPKVLLLDEPTRGVDVGAKSDLYKIIDDLAKAGVAILIISSELPEVVGIADRVIVMREGVLEGEVDGDGLTQEAIIALATAAHDRAAVAAPTSVPITAAH